MEEGGFEPETFGLQVDLILKKHNTIKYFLFDLVGACSNCRKKKYEPSKHKSPQNKNNYEVRVVKTLIKCSWLIICQLSLNIGFI